MVKLRHKGLLVLGMTRSEMEQLREGRPLDIPLGDLHASLRGQRVMIIPGENNDTLKSTMDRVADAYSNGATSPIEIVKALPNEFRKRH